MSEGNKKAHKEGYLASIKRRDPAARSKWSVFWLYPSVRALRYHKVAAFFWRIHFRFLAEMLMHRAKKTTGIEIHPAAKIGRNLFIDHGSGVVIGETTIIGDNVTLYHGVTLGGRSLERIKRHPTLEDDVIVSVGATILGDITIHHGAAIAPGAYISKDVPADCLAFGDDDYRPRKKEK